MRNSMKLAAGVGIALLAAPAAQAHVSVEHLMEAGGGLMAGLSHPFSGADHLLAMLAVGAWAGQQGGRARWAVPGTFVATLVAGGAMAMAGIAIPGVEAGILASVVVLGLVVAMATRLPMAAGLGIVAVAGLFHGHAHGSEMPFAASPALYALGFVLATSALHLAGLALGSAATNGAGQSRLVRLGGAAAAATGLALIASA